MGGAPYTADAFREGAHLSRANRIPKRVVERGRPQHGASRMDMNKKRGVDDDDFAVPDDEVEGLGEEEEEEFYGDDELDDDELDGEDDDDAEFDDEYDEEEYNEDEDLDLEEEDEEE